MGYRIHLGIVKRKDLKEHINKDFSDIKDEFKLWDAQHDFFYESQDVELHDNIDLNQFKVIKEYKDEEYPPYMLNKKDFQKILDYYKQLNLDNYTEKAKISAKEYETDERKTVGVHIMYINISSYFESLIKSNKNIKESGLFLLDYFYLVRLFENMKRNECVIITHG